VLTWSSPRSPYRPFLAAPPARRGASTRERRAHTPRGCRQLGGPAAPPPPPDLVRAIMLGAAEAEPVATPAKKAEAQHHLVAAAASPHTPAAASIAGSLARATPLLPRLLAQQQQEEEEDVLAALERHGEESAARRWTLFQKLVAGLRTQLAECAEGVSECRRRKATLDQQLIDERAAREAGQARASADLQAVAQSLQGELRQVQAEARRTMEGLAAECGAQAKAVQEERTAELQRQVEALMQGGRDEELARHREHKALQQVVEELRSALDKEVDARTQAAAAAADAAAEGASREAVRLKELVAGVDAKVAACQFAIEGRHTTSMAALEAKLQELLAQASARDTSAKEQERTVSELSVRLKEELVAEVNAKVAACQFAMEGRHTTSAAALEAKLQELLAQASVRDTSAKEQERTVSELSVRLKEEREERHKSIEQAQKAAIAAATEAVARDTGALKATLERQDASLGNLALARTQAETEEGHRAKVFEEMQAEVIRLRQKLVADREADNAARERLSVSEQGERRALAERLDRQAEDLVAGVDAKIAACQLALESRHAAGVAAVEERAGGELRKQFRLLEAQGATAAAQLAKLEAQVVALGDTQAAVLKQSQADLETRAGATASQVRAALDAHGEFAEELEREVRANTQMLKTLTDGLTVESNERCKLQQDTRALCLDMQKIRGHLPLCFANFR